MTEEGTESDFLSGFNSLNDYTQQALKTVLKATKCSNELPATEDDFDYYSSFQGVRDVLDIEGNRILNIIQSILRYLSVKGNLSDGSSAVDVEDKFDVLVDANDQILERVGSWLDEASGVKKEESTLLIASTTPKQHGSASWNKTTPRQGSNLPSYRLLAARNIQRPQMKFKEKIDNENRPFVPQLRSKSHAKKSLEDSMRLPSDVLPDMIDKPEFQYPHPYQYELDHLIVSQKQLTASVPVEAKPLEDTECVMVTTVNQLNKLCDILQSNKEIAVDLEHHSYRSFQGLTCVMQISTRTQDFIVDTLELRSNLHVLNNVFTDPSILKVFHGADMDIGWLQRDLGLYIVNMFDTGQAARVLNMNRHSLAFLLDKYCNIQADKQYQLADWRIRPLPEELVKYAREDTHYLLYIYDKMRNELLERGNEQKNLLHSVIQKSTAVCKQVYKKPIFTDDLHMELYKKSKKVFNSRQLSALKNLYSWRDKIARFEDESIGYVLPNHMLLQISEILPRERQGVFACCNPIPPLVRQYLVEIHNIVMEARDVALTSITTPKTKGPSSYNHPKYNPDSLLNCPHDTSCPRLNDAPCLLDTTVLSDSIIRGSVDSITVLKDEPLLTVFKDWIMNNWKLMANTAMKRKEFVRVTQDKSESPAPKRQKVTEFPQISKSTKNVLSSNQVKAKIKEKGDNQEEEEEFTPYDYNKVSLKMFEEGTSNKSNKDVFDPNKGMNKKGKGKKAYKPQFSTSKSQKSSSFGQMDKSQKTQIWPK